MINARVGGSWVLCLVFLLGALHVASGQCPQFSNINFTSDPFLCEGDNFTVTMNGANIPPGSTIDWYIGLGTSFDPYNGEGTQVGNVPVTVETCNNQPEVLYLMVNPDNTQVGSAGDQCDEFMVMWTGSGGFELDDITISNLGPGTLVWDDFAPGNAATFTCGDPLPPGPIPENAILIIQSSPNNNVMINSDVLCASGLPVYVITYTGTVDCMFGYFDNNSPCSSCPINIVIDSDVCDFTLNPTYSPPGSSIDGWAWANTGAGVYADVIPGLTIPVFDPPQISIPTWTYTVRPDFCEMFGENDWYVIGILDPPPPAGCPEITTGYFEVNVSCPELVIMGGGEVCEGNCPDNPTLVSFELIGDDVPFTVDIIVTASVFPPFAINDLPVTNGYAIEVCLGGLFPTFDPGTGVLNVPILAIGITATVEVVSAVSNAGCPVTLNQNSVTLTFIEAPSANAGSNQTICAGEVVHLDGSIGGSATEAEWSTSGDGTFDDPFDLNTDYIPGTDDILNGSVTITLSSTDINGTCTPAESTVEVTIEPTINVGNNGPLAICENDVANVIGFITGGTAPMEWTTSGDGEFDDPFSDNTIYTPGDDDINNGTVILTFEPINPVGCIGLIEPLVLTISQGPTIDYPQNLEFCIGDPVEFTVSFEGELSYVWSAPGGGILTVNNGVEVTYIPSAQDIANQFTIISVTLQSIHPECGSTTFNITVNLNDCNCPDLETVAPTSPLCATLGIIDLDDLLVEGDAGTWSIISVPPGSNPAVINGTLFETNGSDPGAYIVSYNLNSPEPGCPDASTETIFVNAPIAPDAGPDQTICGTDTIALNGNYIPFGGTNFQWASSGDGVFLNSEDLNTSYIPGTADSLAPGIFISLFVMDTVCGDQVDSMTVFFNATPFAEFTNDTFPFCMEPDNSFLINLTSLITGGDNAGIWTNISGAPFVIGNPSAVDFTGIPEGYYAVQYQTNSAVAPCTESTYTIYIQIIDCACPFLSWNNPPTGICNDLSTLPLDAFIQAGAPGSWQILSTPPGGNPATLNGSVLNVNGVDQGPYRLRFTFDLAPIPNCPDSAEIEIFIQDQPGLDLMEDTAVCSDLPLLLSPGISGSTTNIQWTTLGDGVFSSNPALSTIYTLSTNDIIIRRVNIVAATVDTFGFCPAAFDTIEVNISEEAYSVWSSLATSVCNNPDSNSVVILSSFIIDGDINPNWADTDNSGAVLVGSQRYDFAGVPPGTYTFTATTNNANVPPCDNTSYEFEITVRDCECPALVIDQTPIHICKGTAYDLAPVLINADPGTFSVTDGPPGATFPLIIGSTVQSANATPGYYTITYTLDNPEAGCPASDTLSFEVVAIPTATIISRLCDDTQSNYTILLSTDAGVLNANIGDVVDLGGGQFEIQNVPIDLNVTISMATAGSNPCVSSIDVTSPNCACALQVEDLVDTLTLCPGDSFTLIPVMTGVAGFPRIYWIDQDQDTVEWFSFEVKEPGTFIWVVIDSLGCEERDTFTSVFIGPNALDITAFPPLCPNELNGEIVINDVIDGEPPYSIQLDNDAPVAVGVFPYSILQVGVGMHVVSVTDLTGCTLEWPVEVNSSGFGTIDLGPNQTVIKGDSALITPVVTNIGIADVQWSVSGIADVLEPFYITPDTTIIIEVTVTDTSGCIYTDDVVITLIEKSTFYIPNVFSPNNDQVNDIFAVITNTPPDNLVSLEIFDRWGGMVHQQLGDLPFQWDGKIDGEFANPGVYVYKLLWKDENNKVKTIFGDITLLR